jgi:hypothetical protein
MSVPKEHKEFYAVDFSEGWESVPGYPEGIEQKILAGSLDEDRRRGHRTRLLRVRAGAMTSEPVVHDFWEEIYVVSGDLMVHTGGRGESWRTFGPHTHACRPPGVRHGPFQSKGGCLIFEIHYYPDEDGSE